MAVYSQQEMIWQGRIHVGDEPGIYGDAHYNGLAVELPLTLMRFDPQSSDDVPFTLILETQNVATGTGYPGHMITLTSFEPDPAQAYHFVEKPRVSELMTSTDNNRKEIKSTSGTLQGRLYFSLRIRVDTSVSPGLYNDFLCVKLGIESPGLYATFGLQGP